jgi:hypothetical protein
MEMARTVLEPESSLQSNTIALILGIKSSNSNQIQGITAATYCKTSIFSIGTGRAKRSSGSETFPTKSIGKGADLHLFMPAGVFLITTLRLTEVTHGKT